MLLIYLGFSSFPEFEDIVNILFISGDMVKTFTENPSYITTYFKYRIRDAAYFF